MKKIRSKVKALVFATLYTIFSDAQGQITLEMVVVSGQNLNSFKHSCMSLLLERMKMIESKMKELECSQDFSHYKSMDLSSHPRAANSAVLGSIWPIFELVQDFRVVLITCKNEEDRSKMKALLCSQHYTSIFQTCKGK